MTPEELGALAGFLTFGGLAGVLGRWFDLLITSIQGRG